MGTIVIDEKYEACRKILKEEISQKRYLHSIGVSNTAACLAMRYDADVSKAALAGLLHDCAKGLNKEELVVITQENDLEISPIERSNPELLHSKAGAILAKQKYKIDDDGICSAIYWHTTGKPDMTLLEMIIFAADYIEPNRCNIPNLDRIRKTAFVDLKKTTAMICANSIEYLKRSSKEIDRITIDTYDYYNKLSVK